MALSRLVFAAIVVAVTTNFGNSAEVIRKTIDADRTAFLVSTYVLDQKTCRAGPYPQLSVIGADNGKVTSELVRSQQDNGDQCAGTLINHLVIDYTPDPGFRGQDTVKFRVSGARRADGTGHSIRDYRAYLTVQ
ncbi:MAG: hypothetical protein ABJH63_08090 [Rhizobiaceae bacterium]